MENYYSYLCIFIFVHELYNQPHKKDTMCNMIHKNVTKCVGKSIVTIPFVMYILKNIYILGR